MFKVGDKFKVIGNSENKYGKHRFKDGDIVGFLHYYIKWNGKKSKKYIEVAFILNDGSYGIEQVVKLKDLELL